jgi:hypothetical protein
MPDKKSEAFETKNASHFLSVFTFFVLNNIFVSNAFHLKQKKLRFFCQVSLSNFIFVSFLSKILRD